MCIFLLFYLPFVHRDFSRCLVLVENVLLHFEKCPVIHFLFHEQQQQLLARLGHLFHVYQLFQVLHGHFVFSWDFILLFHALHLYHFLDLLGVVNLAIWRNVMGEIILGFPSVNIRLWKRASIFLKVFLILGNVSQMIVLFAMVVLFPLQHPVFWEIRLDGA